MKKLILAFIPAFVLSFQAAGQCCPYVDPIEILPTSPFDTDSVYVVTNVTTPNLGAYLGYDIIDQGTTIRIEACYYSGMLTALQSYTDTINLGLLAGGMYTIEFVAYQSGSDVNCVPNDSTQVTSAVTVTSTLGMDDDSENSFTVYPNPVHGGILYVEAGDGNEIPFRIINALGETVLEGTTGKAGEINVSDLKGVFYLTLSKNNTVLTQQIVVE